MNQTARDIGIQIIQIAGQIAAFVEVQNPLQTNHDAAGAGNALAFFLDRVMRHMALGCDDCINQTVKKHLNQGYVVSH